MTAKEAYKKLYQGVLRDFTHWDQKEVEQVFKLAKADARDGIEKKRDEILQLLEAELDRRRRDKGELVKK